MLRDKSCTKYNTQLHAHATTCPECGFRVSGETVGETAQAGGNTQPSLKIYNLIQLSGGCISCVGLIATFFASSIVTPATVAPTMLLGLGAAIYLTGLLGAWWNTRD
jgi:hypothetical protein